MSASLTRPRRTRAYHLPFAAPLRAVDRVRAEAGADGLAVSATKAVAATDPSARA